MPTFNVQYSQKGFFIAQPIKPADKFLKIEIEIQFLFNTTNSVDQTVTYTWNILIHMYLNMVNQSCNC